MDKGSAAKLDVVGQYSLRIVFLAILNECVGPEEYLLC